MEKTLRNVMGWCAVFLLGFLIAWTAKPTQVKPQHRELTKDEQIAYWKALTERCEGFMYDVERSRGSAAPKTL